MLRQQIFLQPVPQYPAYIIRYKQQERCARNPGGCVSAGTSGTVFPAKAAVFYKIRPHFLPFFQKISYPAFSELQFQPYRPVFFLIKKKSLNLGDMQFF